MPLMFEKSCYYIELKALKSFYEADRSCGHRAPGGHLAYTGSTPEYQFLKEVALQEQKQVLGVCTL